jgi:glycosyltransferase involved in cell wall biosynthesis
MKILVSVQWFYPIKGGAENSLFILLRKLAKDHEIFVIQSGYTKDTKIIENLTIITEPVFPLTLIGKIIKIPKFIIKGIPIYYQAKLWKKVIRKYVEKIEPNIICSQLNFLPPSMDIAEEYGTPSICFIRSYEHFCLKEFINGIDCNRECGKCPRSSLQKWYFLNWQKWLLWHEKSIKKPNLIFANSQFVAQYARKFSGRNIRVLYPSLDEANCDLRASTNRYLTIINPSFEKGGEIFLKIAERMPDKEFLAVGTRKKWFIKRAKDLGNIVVLPWVDDMVEIYSKTKILLIPVKWPEPFGRVAIESGLYGIPKLASNIGGLAESVGDGGILIDEYKNIETWVEKIRYLERDDVYHKYSQSAYGYAKKFCSNDMVVEFKHIVKDEMNITL